MGQASDGMKPTLETTTTTVSVQATATVPPSSDRTEAIRHDIEQTRAEMTETINAIEERLSPSALKEQAKARVREATVGRVEHMARNAGNTVDDARYTFMETVKQNPIPAALAAIGIGWLVKKSREPQVQRSAQYARGRYMEPRYYETGAIGYYDIDEADFRGSVGGVRGVGYEGGVGRQRGGVGDTVHRATDAAGDKAAELKERAGDLAHQTQERVGHLAHQVQHRAEDVADRAQYQARRAEDRFERSLEETPLAVGAVALALGAAAGLAIPRTQKEDALMGSARDQLVEKAQGFAQEAMGKAQHVAERAISETKEAVKDEAPSQGQSFAQGPQGYRY